MSFPGEAKCGAAAELAALVLGFDLTRSEGGLPEESFVRLGGDSLRAMRLAAEAESRLGISLAVQELLGDRPLPEVLSTALSAAAPAVFRASGARPSHGRPTPSSAQRGMLLRERAVGPSPYNLVFIAFMNGPLRPDLLQRVLSETAHRHEGLRTVFPEAHGEIGRRTLHSYAPSLERICFPGQRQDFEEYVRAAAARLGSAPFDSGRTPPLRFTLISAEPAEYALIFSVHHALLDGWAIGLILREIFTSYAAAAEGKHLNLGPTVTFDEYLRWLSGLRDAGELDRQAAFWRRELKGVPTVLDIPADQARPAVQRPHGARIPLDLGPELSAEVVSRAGQLGVTHGAFMLGAFALTLSRYTGAESILVGMPVAVRPTPALMELVAVTVGLIPIRVDMHYELTAADYLARVQSALSRGLDNSALPFDELVAELEESSPRDRHPLVQVAFGMHDGLIPADLSTGPMKIRIEEAHGGGAQFDLELFISQREPSFAGSLEYATGVWGPAEAAAFRASLIAAVQGLARPPESIVADIRCVAPAGPAMLTLDATAKPCPALTVDELFRQQVEQRPQATAVQEGRSSLSYADLATAAARQAAMLAENGVTPGSTVLIGLERSIAEVVAVLGTLWAGAAYAAIEASTPSSRVEELIAVLRPAALIGDLSHGDTALSLPQVQPWSDSWSRLAPVRFPVPPPDPGRLAYIALTSGSTGKPKGVCVPHRGVVRLVCGLPGYAPIGPGDRMLRFSPLAFDASTFELWGALLTGATLEVGPPGLPSPSELGSFIWDADITVAWLTSGLFRLVSEFAPDTLAALRHLLTGGDVVPADHVRRLLSLHRGLTIINAYGPTENTTFTTVYQMTDPAAVEDDVPIGGPIAYTQVHIVDRHRRLLPPGAVGELCVSGDGLAAGYFGDDEQTAASFGRLAPDVPARVYATGDLVRLDSRGRLRFLGRIDDQVKIRGFRVEPGEIRKTLMGHQQVSDAFVTAIGEGAEKQLLAACISASGDLAAADLAAYLADRLPGYMTPSLWAMVSEFPLTANGKTDRAALHRMACPVAAHAPASR